MVPENFDDIRVIKSRVNHLAQGKTLLEYLVNRFSYHDQIMWQKEINSGCLRLNGNLANQDVILKCGDELSYLPENVVEPEVDLNYSIVFEDDYILVIDKPGNLPTHPAGAYMQNTLWFNLRKTYGAVYPVNRLDMETSGLLIFTKEAKLSGEFAKQKMHKNYYALVHGIFDQTIEANGFLYRDINSVVRKRRKFSFANIEDYDGKLKVESSITTLEGVRNNGKYSLVRATLGTGRTHQIRATLCSLNFPVVGDKIYGLDDNFFLKRKEDRLTDEDREMLVLKRQALHSYNLRFTHVITNEVMEFTSDIPAEFNQLLAEF